MQLASGIRRRLLGIDPAEVRFARRGFPLDDPAATARLEHVAAHFVRGYEAALRDPRLPALETALEAIEFETRGFAYEGAGMALELLDRLVPGRGGRFAALLAGPGEPHTYMVHIGAGWAWARLPGWLASPERCLASLDPLLGCFALDGYGFHEGFFHPERTFRDGLRPARVSSWMEPIFDTGAGRSLWFASGAAPERIAATVLALDPMRAPQLWAGVGLACAYAGGVDRAAIEGLRELAREHRPALAQGAAFAAKARERAGNPAAHSALAVETLCGISAPDAARRCDRALAEVESRGKASAGPSRFHAWRERLQRDFRSDFQKEFAAGLQAQSVPLAAAGGFS